LEEVGSAPKDSFSRCVPTKVIQSFSANAVPSATVTPIFDLVPGAAAILDNVAEGRLLSDEVGLGQDHRGWAGAQGVFAASDGAACAHPHPVGAGRAMERKIGVQVQEYRICHVQRRTLSPAKAKSLASFPLCNCIDSKEEIRELRMLALPAPWHDPVRLLEATQGFARL